MLVIDLKVLVKSFNCEDLLCYAGNPRESIFVYFYFWRVCESQLFYSRKFRESWSMNHYYFIILYAYTAC